MIIGTAGHIDHGKTTLVRALTGVDTDRLKEEKARGISIELGYAYVPIEGGGMLGFIDVPGHEKFVATMLAGATGIDFGLVVVAADDGVMPQTREHVQILDMLGVREGAVALTKIDRADESRAAAVEREMAALLGPTTLAGAPVFRVDAPRGTGIDALRAHLFTAAQGHQARSAGGHFRLAVDRSFSLSGAGTVVTGTVFSGRVAVGDDVRIAPRGLTARVRSIHAQNRSATEGRAGERCALNLAGIAREDVSRGDWVAAPALDMASDRVDVELHLAASEPRALSTWVPLHVHSGAAHLTARAVPLEPAAIAPGTTGLAQLVLSAPTLLVQGDILVLRDTSASRTVGRARVLDARAPARRRRTPHRLAVLEALRATDVAERLRCLVEMTPTGVDLAVFARDANLRESECPAPEPDWRVVDDGGARRAFAARHWKASSERAVAALAGFHAREPDRLGPDGARFRRLCLPEATPETAAAMVRAWVREGVLAQSGPWLHLPGHTVALTEAERRVFRVLASLIASGNYDPPWVRSLAAEIRLEEAQVRRLLVKAARLGELHQVVKDLFYAPPVIARLAGLVNDIAAREGVVRAADFRDATGLGRKRAIQILEYFDRVGFTRRIRDDHVVRDARMFEPAEARAA